ncbi:type III pantothenate kinase [Alkalimonas sp. MEB108]|uniref:Type III pantothenate kinase n=1 Tax=Alkalimonas cellulosilytica TaxID=3058395 RepID=A0ABU7JA73_9GAMM|nr:type III pantothenate kinase [Alkalimonas sp. MEB108]MEE2002887.1 type III pantothenate kinase [Alkalimonas sp. MEB108]
MYLLLDIGNTRSKAMLASSAGSMQRLDLQSSTVDVSAVQAVYYAAVAGQDKVQLLKKQLQLHNAPWRQIESDAYSFGVRNCYSQPHLLGVDRWLGVLGANWLQPDTDVLVVDAGTAVTLDWLSAGGEHQGGWILPGLKLQQQSVVQKTAKVFNADTHQARLQLGDDTVSCLQNGCLAAVLGSIQQAWQLQPMQQLVLTGGDAPFLAPYLKQYPLRLEPDLLFYGLSRFIDS